MAERLTFEGNFCEIARCRENRWGKHCPDGACSQRKVWERLKEYEDAADVAPVRHGRWVCGDYYDVGDVCSECDWDSQMICPSYRYCPNCGARMTEDIDEQKK